MQLSMVCSGSMNGSEREPTSTAERRVGFDQISEAKKSNDVDRLRKAIQEFFDDEATQNPFEIFLAGMYAARYGGDDHLVDRAIEKERALNSWGHVVWLLAAFKKDIPGAVEAKNLQCEYLLNRGEFREAEKAVTETTLLSSEEKGSYYRRMFAELFAHDEFLEAAFLAKKFRSYGFSDEKITDAATRAYRQALEYPISELKDDDTVLVSDAELIVQEFDLDQSKLAA